MNSVWLQEYAYIDVCVCVCINSVRYCYGAIEQMNLIAVKETNKALQMAD